MTKIEALAEFLECEEGEIQEVSYNENLFELGNQEYLVLTDREADQAALEDIKESLWAFNSSFLADQTDIPKEVFKVLSEKCESGNDAILKLINKTCGLQSFVEEAISTDGRGHFLNRYDGSEEELNGFYIYRTN